MTPDAIHEAALSGDRLARPTLYEIGTFLGEACSKIVASYNPRPLVIGVPAARLGEFLREPIWTGVRRRVLPELLEGRALDVAMSDPRDEAMGAAILAESRSWKTAPTARFSPPAP